MSSHNLMLPRCSHNLMLPRCFLNSANDLISGSIYVPESSPVSLKQMKPSDLKHYKAVGFKHKSYGVRNSFRYYMKEKVLFPDKSTTTVKKLLTDTFPEVKMLRKCYGILADLGSNVDLFALPKDHRCHEYKEMNEGFNWLADELRKKWPMGFESVNVERIPFDSFAQEMNLATETPFLMWQQSKPLIQAKIIVKMVEEMARGRGTLKGFYYVLVKGDSITFIAKNHFVKDKAEYDQIVGDGELYLFPPDVEATGYTVPQKYARRNARLDLNTLALIYARFKNCEIDFFKTRTYTSDTHVEFGKIPCQRCGSGQELNGILAEHSLVKIILEFCPLREIPEVLCNKYIPYCNICCKYIIIETPVSSAPDASLVSLVSPAPDASPAPRHKKRRERKTPASPAPDASSASAASPAPDVSSASAASGATSDAVSAAAAPDTTSKGRCLDFEMDFKEAARRLFELFSKMNFGEVLNILVELIQSEYFNIARDFAMRAQLMQQYCRSETLDGPCLICGNRCGAYYAYPQLPKSVLTLDCGKSVEELSAIWNKKVGKKL